MGGEGGIRGFRGARGGWGEVLRDGRACGGRGGWLRGWLGGGGGVDGVLWNCLRFL